MTKSEYPQHNGAPVAQPQHPADTQQPPLPPQPLPASEYAPPVAPPSQQPVPAQQMAPVHAVPPQPQPQTVAPAPHEVPGIPGQPVYAEHVPVPAQPIAHSPAGVPVDDYHYPQESQTAQSILPEVPAVAVPPGMNAAGEQRLPTHQAPQMAAPAENHAGTGEQISQRLAQLQSQYDDEMSGNVQMAAETNPQYAPQISEPVPPLQAPVEENAAFEPVVASTELPQHQFAEQVAYTPEPPMSHEQVSHEYEPAPVAAASMAAEAGDSQYSYEDPNSYENQMAAPVSEFAPEIEQELPTSKGGFKKLALGGAFVAALAVGGGAAYTGKMGDMFGGKTASGPAPTIKAASSSMKIIKQNQAGSGDSINKAVHNRLNGGASRSVSAGGVGENIVRKANSAIGAINGARTGMMPNNGNKSRSISIGSNVPRRVKTLIVRPDGTIMAPAGSRSLNSRANDRPSSGIIAENLSGIPGETVTKVRRMKPLRRPDSMRAMGQNVRKAAPRVKVVSLQPPARRKIKVAAPVTPVIKRVSRSAAIPGDIGTPFVVQVTARSSQSSALAAFADMQQKYPSLLGEYAPDIQRADLGSKGIWYRLRVGPVNGKTAAADLCSNLKQAGHPGCFVRRK